METYREESGRGREQTIIGAVVLTALLAWLGWQIGKYHDGTGTFGMIIYVVCFLGLFIWRCGFRYVCAVDDQVVTITTSGLGLDRRLTVKLAEIESFATEYRKKFFRNTGIKKYIYRYSALDPHPVRIIVFKRAGKLEALLFKSSDEFVRRLGERMPDRVLNFD